MKSTNAAFGWTALVVIGVATFATPAFAQGTAASEKARAKEAYDRGVEAHRRGDFQRAAREFAEADAIAPSNVALQAALDAAIDADDPALGAELVERANRTAPPPAMSASIDAARRKLGGRAGRVTVACPASSSCRSTLDGVVMDSKKPSWTKTGTHTVVVAVDGGESQTRIVEVKADQTEVLTPNRPPGAAALPLTADGSPAGPSGPPARSKASLDASTPNDHPSKKLPSGVFWGGVAGTAVSTAIATALMINAQSKHEDFTSAGCERANEPSCLTLKDSGEGAQTAANVAIGVTAVLAVATVIVGVAFTEWHPGTKDAGASTLRRDPLRAATPAGPGPLFRF